MTKRNWKRIARWGLGVVAGLAAVLAVHIWWVMRPRVDAGTRVMARIDLHQQIGKGDADRIKSWLYRQQGVKYVLVNPVAEMAVFSFAPLQNDGNRIVKELREQLGFGQAQRYLPAAGKSGGCPAGF